MSVAFAERERELNEQIAAIPLENKESRAVLFFSGKPVHGSLGIDAAFASRVLEPFQNMVMADYADRKHGKVCGRHGEAQSRLLLTGLPRGSFDHCRQEAQSLDWNPLSLPSDRPADVLGLSPRTSKCGGSGKSFFVPTPEQDQCPARRDRFQCRFDLLHGSALAHEPHRLRGKNFRTAE